MIVRTAGALLARTYNRYLMASLVSLGCDTALFLALLQAGMAPVAASAAGYGLGIVVHWLVSTRFVFEGGMASAGLERARQKGLFVVTALAGLAITMAIVGMAAHAGLDARLAKLVAIVVSFQATYLARRATVFRA